MPAGTVGPAARRLRLGYHGKVPVRGDFVSRNLDRAFLHELDGWLRLWVRAGQEAMGERWLDAFLQAPIWHFVLRRSAQTVAGSMIPSVDAVGRYFPFVLAVELPDGDLAAADRLLSGLEPHLLSVLDEDFDLADLDRRLERHRAPTETPGAARMDVPDAPSDALSDTLPDTLRDAPCLWWTKGTPRRPPAVLAFEDWPPAGAAVSFLEEPRDMALDALWERCRDMRDRTADAAGTAALVLPLAGASGVEVAVAEWTGHGAPGRPVFARGPHGTVMSDGRVGTRHDATAARLVAHALAEGMADAARLERFLRARLRDKDAGFLPYLSFLHLEASEGAVRVDLQGDVRLWLHDANGWRRLADEGPDHEGTGDDTLRLDPRHPRSLRVTLDGATLVGATAADFLAMPSDTDGGAGALAERIAQEAVVAGAPSVAVLVARGGRPPDPDLPPPGTSV